MAEKAETWRRGSAAKLQAGLALDNETPTCCRNWGRCTSVRWRPASSKRLLRPLALVGKHAAMRMVAARTVAVLE